MSNTATCVCGQQVQIPSHPDGVPINCPACGRIIEPNRVDRASLESGVEIPESEFVSVFAKSPTEAITPPTLLQLLLDPSTIQRLLMFGGGLSVLGLIAWLVSLGVFDDPRILALALGAGTLAMLSSGWFVVLKTRYQLAGRALTFLACVVAPLNLWFYSAQELLTVDGHLWVGGLICSVLYILTVWKLRDPLFLYAVEAGVTLTALLLLGDLQRATDSTALCLVMIVLAGISIHAEAAFDPEHPIFSRKRFGLPLFFCGQLQLAIGTISLLVLQALDGVMKPVAGDWAFSELAGNPWMATGLWFVASYLWFYSDFAVRRLSIYSYLAAMALVLAEVTLLNHHLPVEALMIALSMTGMILQAVNRTLTPAQSRWSSVATRIGTLIGAATLTMGLARHFQLVSHGVPQTTYDSTMYLVAMGSIAVAWLVQGLSQKVGPKLDQTAEFICAGVAIWLGAMHLLPMIGAEKFGQQAPLLALVPLVVVSLCRGTVARERNFVIAVAAHVVVVLGFLISAISSDGDDVIRFVLSRDASPSACLLFAELAALCFVTAVSPTFRPALLALAGLWSWGACWKIIAYIDLPEVWLAPLLSAVGVAFLAARVWRTAATASSPQIAGEQWFVVGDVSLLLGELLAFFQTLPWLIGPLAPIAGWKLVAIGLTGMLSVVGGILTSSSSLKRAHRFSLMTLTVATFAAWIRTQQLADYQKVELMLEALGIACLGWGSVARLRETDQRQFAAVSFSLWVGSLLATLPVLSCMLMHRWSPAGPSLADELGLITVAIVMVAAGCVLQIRSATTVGGFSLGIYLAVLFGHLAYHPQVAIGVYLAAGGSLIFLTGVALSVYRDRLLALPSKIENREGIFQVIDWR